MNGSIIVDEFTETLEPDGSTSVFIGPTALGTSRSGQIVVTNIGLDPQQTSPLTVSNVSVLSNDPAWVLDTSTPIDVGEPGAQATVRFSFHPQQAGLSQAVLVIASNDGLHPNVQVPVAANGRDLQPCTLSVSPGTQRLEATGESVVYTVSVTALGSFAR